MGMSRISLGKGRGNRREYDRSKEGVFRLHSRKWLVRVLVKHFKSNHSVFTSISQHKRSYYCLQRIYETDTRREI